MTGSISDTGCKAVAGKAQKAGSLDPSEYARSQTPPHGGATIPYPPPSMLSAARAAASAARAAAHRRGVSALAVKCAPCHALCLLRERISLRAHASPDTRCVHHPAGRVSEEQRAEYSRDGAVCIRGAFSQEWIERLRACAEDNLRQPGPLCDEHVPAGEPGARTACARPRPDLCAALRVCSRRPPLRPPIALPAM